MKQCLFTYLLLILTAMLSVHSVAQTVDPEAYRFVIGAGYTSGGDDNLVIDATVGEAVTFTGTSLDLIVTQGFQQSNYVLANPFIINLSSSAESCRGSSDGEAVIDFISENVEAPYSYSWSTGDTTASIGQLNTGTYTVTVTGSNGAQVFNSILVDIETDVECTPGFYTGITPNNDGDNDTWFVDNVQFFETREVQIFNRYGDRVWETSEYDNDFSFFEGRHQNGQELPDATYYYIANFNGVTYKGWIEITR